MGARITWDDRNDGASQEDGFRIYRSGSPISAAALPAPIATLGPNARAFDDLTELSGVQHYAVGAFKGGFERIASQPPISFGVAAPVPWSPASLFASGERGGFYDPSDLTTLFQDQDGITPVTSDGDPVGLMLPVGIAFGPNLMVNGDFSSGTTGWAADGGVLMSVVGGQLLVDRNGSASEKGIYKSVPTEVGVTYRLRTDVVDDGIYNAFRFGAWDGATSLVVREVMQNLSNPQAIYFVAKTTSTDIAVIATGHINNTGKCDNIIVQKMSRMPFTAATTARPTYKTSGGKHWLLFDGTSDVIRLTNHGDALMDGGGCIVGAFGADVDLTIDGVMEERSLAGVTSRVVLLADTRSYDFIHSIYAADGTTRRIDDVSKWDLSNRVSIINSDGINAIGYTDGVAIGSPVSSTSNLGSLTFLAIGRQTSGSLYFPGRWYGGVFRDTVLSAEDLVEVNAFFSGKI